MKMLFALCFGMLVFYALAVPQFRLAQKHMNQLTTVLAVAR